MKLRIKESNSLNEYRRQYFQSFANDDSVCSKCNATSDDVKLYSVDKTGETVCEGCIVEYLLDEYVMNNYKGSELVKELSRLYSISHDGEETEFVDNGDGTYYSIVFEEDIPEKEVIEILRDYIIDAGNDIDKETLMEMFPEESFYPVETSYSDETVIDADF